MGFYNVSYKAKFQVKQDCEEEKYHKWWIFRYGRVISSRDKQDYRECPDWKSTEVEY